jgi:hypothetical protein
VTDAVLVRRIVQETEEFSGDPIQLVEAVCSAYPKIALPIFVDAVDRVIAEAGRVLRVVPLMYESTAGLFHVVEPGGGTDPQLAAMVPIDTIDIVVR